MMESAFYLSFAHVWQVTTLIVIAFLLEHLIGKRFPQVMAAVWLAIVVKCIIPPVFASPTGIFSWARINVSGGIPKVDFVKQGSAIATALFAIWFCGALFVLLTSIHRWRRFTHALRQCEKDSDLQVRVDQIGADLGLKVRPRLLVSPVDSGPLTTGIWKPIIVVPRRLVEGVDVSHLDPIIAHELVHIRRRDSLVGLLQIVATFFFWFHPFVRWAIRRMDINIEHCVDSEVISDLKFDVDHYASGLVRVLRLNAQTPSIPGIAPMSPKQISKDRIRHVFKSGHRRSRTAARLFFVVILLFFIPGQALQVHPWRLDDQLPFEPCRTILSSSTPNSGH